MPSLNTGNAILSNAIAVNSSYNVGIGGAASGTFKLDVNGSVNLAGNVTTTGAQFVQNGFYLANANAGATAFYTNMWGADDGVQFALRNLTGGARFIFQSATSYNYTFPAATGTIALTSNIPTVSGTSGYFAKFTGSSAVGNSSFVTETGTGVGFQIASPLSLLHMNGQSGTAGLPSLLLYGEAPSNGQRYGFNVSADQLDISALGTSASIGFYTGGNASSITRKMLITSGGNVGIATSTIPNNLGVAMQLGPTVNLMSYVGNAYFLNNWYYDSSGNAKYITSSFASGITQNGSGELRFFTNPSGTANATFTPAERLMITNGGNVLIGTTTDNGGKLQVNGVTQLRDTLILVKQTSSIYNQTSTSGNTSIVDTGIFYNTSIIGYGVSSIYQVTISGNPQNLGSGEYRNTVLGYISIQTGFNGSVVQTITWNQIFSNDGGTLTPFTISIRFWNGSSENTSVPAGSTNNQIRIKIAAYGGTVGAGQDVRIIKITD